MWKKDVLKIAAGGSSFLGASLIAYSPSLRGPFLLDDGDWMTSHSFLWKAMGGDSPLLHHLEGVILHAGNSTLLWGVLSSLSLPYPFLSSLIFCLHPLASQAVTYSYGNLAILYTIPYLLSLLLFVRWKSRLRWLLPLILLSSFLWFHHNRSILQWDSPFRHWEDRVPPSPGEMFLTNLEEVPTYFLPRLLFPLHLSICPDLPQISLGMVIFSSFIWIALLLLPFFSLLPLEVRLGIGVFSYSPLLPLLLSGGSSFWISEYHAYLSLLGVGFLSSWLLKEGKWLALPLLLSFFLLTFQESDKWSSPLLVWESAAKLSRTNSIPHLNYGVELFNLERYEEAEKEFTSSILINPSTWAAWSNLASVRRIKGDTMSADQIDEFLKERSPNFVDLLLQSRSRRNGGTE